MDKLQQLKNKYIVSFKQKETDLRIAWGNNDLEKLEGLIHKLTGSSGSYGFDRLSHLCRQVMEQINDSIELLDKKLLEVNLLAVFTEMNNYTESC